MKRLNILLCVLTAIVIAFLFAGCDEIKAASVPALGWDSPQKPHRVAWSKFLVSEVDRTFAAFDSAKDAKRFCAKYATLDHAKKVHVWAEALVWVMFYESAWKPTSWMIESSMGRDPVTGAQVKSEGLFQMSYQDTKWAKTCRFEWDKDKGLKQDDPRKTIFDPFKNMQCGVDVLTRQITRKGFVILSKGVYWAVLRDNPKVKRITDKTNRLPFCN